MKKIKLLVILLLAVLMVPVYAKDFGVVIDSVSLDEKSEKVKVLTDSSFNDLDVNFHLNFFNVGEYARYKIVLANDSSEDYFISDEEVVKDYLKYTYSFFFSFFFFK